ncbi:hypothetical protein DSECCO2_400370 [anaerobic digester metagenome]
MSVFYHGAQNFLIGFYGVVPVPSRLKGFCSLRLRTPARFYRIPALFLYHFFSCHPGSSAADHFSGRVQDNDFVLSFNLRVCIKDSGSQDTCPFFKDERQNFLFNNDPFFQVFPIPALKKPSCPFEAGKKDPFAAFYFKSNRCKDFPVHYNFIHPVFIRGFVKNHKVTFGDKSSIKLFFRNGIYALDIIIKSRANISGRSYFNFFCSSAAPALFSEHRHIAGLAPVQEHFAKVCWSGHITQIE